MYRRMNFVVRGRNLLRFGNIHLFMLTKMQCNSFNVKNYTYLC